MPEIWKDIAGFEGLYQVSTEGRVRSVDTWRPHVSGLRFWKSRIIATWRGKHKYRGCSLWKIGAKKPAYLRVHVLVAEAFLGPRPTAKHEPNHIDGVKSNCRADNLEWLTRKENLYHARVLLGHGGSRKLTDAQVRKIRSSSELVTALAKRHKVSRDCIRAVRHRKTYQHVI